MKAFISFISLALALSAQANQKGNGGCPECDKFYELGTDIAVEHLQKRVQVEKLVPLLANGGVMRLYQKVINSVVIPGDPAKMNGRTAISYPDTGITELDVAGYEKLPYGRKLRLRVHENLVLVSVEQDGFYGWTRMLMRLHPNYDRLEDQTTDYNCYEHHCVLIKPYYTLKKYYYPIATNSEVNGVCRYFGFKGNGRIQDSFSATANIAILDKDQAPKFSSDSWGSIIRTLVCDK